MPLCHVHSEAPPPALQTTTGLMGKRTPGVPTSSHTRGASISPKSKNQSHLLFSRNVATIFLEVTNTRDALRPTNDFYMSDQQHMAPGRRDDTLSTERTAWDVQPATRDSMRTLTSIQTLSDHLLCFSTHWERRKAGLER